MIARGRNNKESGTEVGDGACWNFEAVSEIFFLLHDDDDVILGLPMVASLFVDLLALNRTSLSLFDSFTPMVGRAIKKGAYSRVSACLPFVGYSLFSKYLLCFSLLNHSSS